MGQKLSGDVIPITDLKLNPGRVVKHAATVNRPALLTKRGHGVAGTQSLRDSEIAEKERLFRQSVIAGLTDLEPSREVSLVCCPRNTHTIECGRP